MDHLISSITRHRSLNLCSMWNENVKCKQNRMKDLIVEGEDAKAKDGAEAESELEPKEASKVYEAKTEEAVKV